MTPPRRPNSKSPLSLASLLAALHLGGHERPMSHLRPLTSKQIAEQEARRREAAQQAGNARRLAAWKRSCAQGYEVKIAKGQTGGIPRWWLQQNGHV